MPPSASSKRPRRARDRAGEGALLVTEELALEQGLDEGRAVDGDERAVRARARAWMASATSSLPVPLSPWMSTVLSVRATLRIAATRPRMAGSSPTRCRAGMTEGLRWVRGPSASKILFARTRGTALEQVESRGLTAEQSHVAAREECGADVVAERPGDRVPHRDGLVDVGARPLDIAERGVNLGGDEVDLAEDLFLARCTREAHCAVGQLRVELAFGACEHEVEEGNLRRREIGGLEVAGMFDGGRRTRDVSVLEGDAGCDALRATAELVRFDRALLGEGLAHLALCVDRSPAQEGEARGVEAEADRERGRHPRPEQAPPERDGVVGVVEEPDLPAEIREVREDERGREPVTDAEALLQRSFGEREGVAVLVTPCRDDREVVEREGAGPVIAGALALVEH